MLIIWTKVGENPLKLVKVRGINYLDQRKEVKTLICSKGHFILEERRQAMFLLYFFSVIATLKVQYK